MKRTLTILLSLVFIMTACKEQSDDTIVFEEEQDQVLFMALRESDPELTQTVVEARQSVGQFISAFPGSNSIDRHFSFKAYVDTGSDQAHLWYSLVQIEGDDLIGEHVQIPKAFKKYEVIRVHKRKIEDWMILDDGVLYGGLSLRYQRAMLPTKERKSFDKHIGVETYGTLQQDAAADAKKQRR